MKISNGRKERAYIRLQRSQQNIHRRIRKREEEMNQRRMPSVLGRSTTTQIQADLPTQEDQIRNYRTTSRRMHNLSRSMKNRFGRSYKRSLEAELNPDQQLEVSRQRRAELVPAEILYGSNRQADYETQSISTLLRTTNTLCRRK